MRVLLFHLFPSKHTTLQRQNVQSTNNNLFFLRKAGRADADSCVLCYVSTILIGRVHSEDSIRQQGGNFSRNWRASLHLGRGFGIWIHILKFIIPTSTLLQSYRRNVRSRFFHNYQMLNLPNSMECLILRFQGCCPQRQRRLIRGTSPSRCASLLQCHQSFRACTNVVYSNFLPFIIRRICSSQGPNSMPTKDFAQQIVSNALRKNPSRYMSIGRGSWLFAWLKWLPSGLVLAYMWRLYSS